MNARALKRVRVLGLDIKGIAVLVTAVTPLLLQLRCNYSTQQQLEASDAKYAGAGELLNLEARLTTRIDSLVTAIHQLERRGPRAAPPSSVSQRGAGHAGRTFLGWLTAPFHRAGGEDARRSG